MGIFRALSSGLLALTNRKRTEREMDEELNSFLEASAAEKRRAGMAPEAASLAARIEMGSTHVVKHRIRSAAWEVSFENIMHDVRYSLRILARSPIFFLVAVLSLALGIGANTAFFSLINAIMLRSLPVEKPSELVLFGHAREVGSTGSLPNQSWDLFSNPIYRTFNQKNQVFTGIAAICSVQFATHGSFAGQVAEQVHASLVSGNYFSLLGVNPERGRLLADSDDQASGAGNVAVASYAWWLRHGADPNAIGKTIHIENTDYTVVGIAPAGFFGITVGDSPDFWIPISMQKEISPGWNGLNDKWFQSLYLLARLKPGVSKTQASANINLLLKETLRSEYLGAAPSAKDLADIAHAQIELTPAARGFSRLRSELSLPLEVLLAIAALVLLIACANLANLLLARGAARSREFAMRMAIGATRARIARQLLTESFILAGIGSALGVAIAWKAGYLLLTMASHRGQAVAIDVVPDRAVLAFSLALTILTALLSGSVPALRATRFDLNRSLKQGRAATASSRISLARCIIVAQVALSLVLLAASGVFLRSLVNLTRVDTGFNSQNVLIFSLDEYAANLPLDRRLVLLQHQIEDRVQSLPGVHAAAFSTFTFNQSVWSDDITVQGAPRNAKTSGDVYFNTVGNGFFSAFSLPILAGRGFNTNDTIDSPKVAVINQKMAHSFFPNSSAIGHRFGFGDDPTHSGDFQIVGVVKNAKYVALQEDLAPAIYFPYAQRVQYFGNLSVRYSGNTSDMMSAVPRAVSAINPNILTASVSTLAGKVEDSAAYPRLIARLSSFFGALAAFLVCIGIYGLLSYAVARRTSEIGVRMALGARRSHVLWLILRETLVLLVIGVAIGLPLALMGNRLIAKLLYGLSPADPLSFLGAACLLAGIAILAGYIPARRAARVEPTIALRCE